MPKILDPQNVLSSPFTKANCAYEPLCRDGVRSERSIGSNRYSGSITFGSL